MASLGEESRKEMTDIEIRSFGRRMSHPGEGIRGVAGTECHGRRNRNKGYVEPESQ